MPQKRKLWYCHHKFVKINFVDSKYVFVRNFHQKCSDSMFLQPLKFSLILTVLVTQWFVFISRRFFFHTILTFLSFLYLLIIWYFVTWFLNCTRFQNHFRCHIKSDTNSRCHEVIQSTASARKTKRLEEDAKKCMESTPATLCFGLQKISFSNRSWIFLFFCRFFWIFLGCSAFFRMYLLSGWC